MKSKTSTKELVFRCIEKVIKRPVGHVDLEGNLKTELNLDSIQIVELFATLEEELNVELPLQLMTVKTGNEFLENLQDIYSTKAPR